jgi:hypothetical protein
MKIFTAFTVTVVAASIVPQGVAHGHHHSNDFTKNRTTLFQSPSTTKHHENDAGVDEDSLYHSSSKSLFHPPRPKHDTTRKPASIAKVSSSAQLVSLDGQFDSWIFEFEKEYNTVEEKMHRFEVWKENHGAYTVASCAVSFHGCTLFILYVIHLILQRSLMSRDSFH